MPLPVYRAYMPRYSFGGRGVKRRATRGEGNPLFPGPGTYKEAEDAAIGKQRNSRKQNAVKPYMARTSRAQADMMLESSFIPVSTRESPGPGGYDLREFSSAVMPSKPPRASAAFGEAALGLRHHIRRRGPAAPASPGPGAYVKQRRPVKPKVSKSTKAFVCHTPRLSPWEYSTLAPGTTARNVILVETQKKQASTVMFEQVSSLGNSAVRPTSASHSFGLRRPARVLKRPELTTTHSGRFKRNDAERKNRALEKQNKYAWLFANPHGASTPRRPREEWPSSYKKQPDGADIARSREFDRASGHSFGRYDRFTEADYTPHSPIHRSDATPGPAHYDLPDATLQDTPSYSFPRTLAHESSRASFVSIDVASENNPGPGAYNLRFEDRVGDKEDDDDCSLLSATHRRRFDAREYRKKKSELFSRSLVGATEDLGLKFGDVSTLETAPAFTFSTTNRREHARRYDEGELNKERAGADSPGPTHTAKQGIYTHKVSTGEQYQETTPSAFSFGGAKVDRRSYLGKVSTTEVVGPADFGNFDEHGRQLIDQPPQIKFGTSRRNDNDLIHEKYDDPPHIIRGQSNLTYANTPGPDAYFGTQSTKPDKMKAIGSLGDQAASPKPTSPRARFTKSTREQGAIVYRPELKENPPMMRNPNWPK